MKPQISFCKQLAVRLLLVILNTVGIDDIQKQLYALNMLILVLPQVNRNVLLVSIYVLFVINSFYDTLAGFACDIIDTLI